MLVRFLHPLNLLVLGATHALPGSPSQTRFHSPVRKLSSNIGDSTGAQNHPQGHHSEPHLPQQDKFEPSAMHWLLTVALSAVLIVGLLRVCCVLKTGESMAIVRNPPEGMRPVECGACHTVQYVSNSGRVFLCFSCRSANRIPIELPHVQQQELVTTTGPLRSYEFKKGGENFWQELKQEELDEAEAGAASETNAHGAGVPVILGRRLDDGIASNTSDTDVSRSNALPQCVVCLDSIGRMVLLPCAHGGVCEECATRIAQNRASGGAHCPHCRSDIHTLVKINEIDGDLAKGIEHRIPMARVI